MQVEVGQKFESANQIALVTKVSEKRVSFKVQWKCDGSWNSSTNCWSHSEFHKRFYGRV